MARLILFIVLFAYLTACSKRKTIFIDSRLQTQRQLDKLDTSDIFSITTWAPGEAPMFYQKWNKDIVVVVKTKLVEEQLQFEKHKLLNRLLDSAENGAEILIVCNGLVVPKDSQMKLRKLLPSQLSKADTMSFAEANNLFGSAARATTLLINTYDPKIDRNWSD